MNATKFFWSLIFFSIGLLTGASLLELGGIFAVVMLVDYAYGI